MYDELTPFEKEVLEKYYPHMLFPWQRRAMELDIISDPLTHISTKDSNDPKST